MRMREPWRQRSREKLLPTVVLQKKYSSEKAVNNIHTVDVAQQAVFAKTTQ